MPVPILVAIARGVRGRAARIMCHRGIACELLAESTPSSRYARRGPPGQFPLEHIEEKRGTGSECAYDEPREETQAWA